MNKDILINVQNIKNHNLLMELKGIYIKYKTNTYFITCNHGFSIKSININDTKIIDFTNCLWNELLFLKTSCSKNQFVFSLFLTKQIDSTKKFLIKDNTEVQYIENIYLPLNMLPDNPLNLYYKMKIIDTNNNISNGDSGSAVYDTNKKLIGIFSKQEDEYIYVIPIYYIIKSLEKKRNTKIYSLQAKLDRISKINFNIIKTNNTIYHKSLKTYIPLKCYLNLESDIDTIFRVTEGNVSKNYKSIELKTTYKNSFSYKIKGNNITFTSSFLRYLKEISINQLIHNFDNILNLRNFNIELNEQKFNVIF